MLQKSLNLLEWGLLIITANINLLLSLTYLKHFIDTMDNIQSTKKKENVLSYLGYIPVHPH